MCRISCKPVACLDPDVFPVMIAIDMQILFARWLLVSSIVLGDLVSLTCGRLMEEGKLMEALSISDRWLRDGAPDQLLQLLIEKGEESEADSGKQWQGNNSSHPHSSSWQYCIRLRNKTLAATLALKWVKDWPNDALSISNHDILPFKFQSRVFFSCLFAWRRCI